MWGRPGCLLKSTAGEANRILLASALSSMRAVKLKVWTLAIAPLT